MNKIIAYTFIIRRLENEGIDFVKIINEQINEGWQPFGGMQIFNNIDSLYFVQVMVRYE